MRNHYRSKVCNVIADKGEMSKINYGYVIHACKMFVLKTIKSVFLLLSRYDIKPKRLNDTLDNRISQFTSVENPKFFGNYL